MMKVEFNPSVSFRANDNNIQGKGKVELPDNKLSATNDSIDKLEIPAERLAQNAKPEKKGFIREGIAKFWKFFSVTDRMANAVLQGLLYGAAAGVALLGGSWLFKSLPKAFSKEGPTLWQTIRHPLKNIGKSGKVIAAYRDWETNKI